MPGETDLKTLLGSMRPAVAPACYVFATFPVGEAIPAELNPLMHFREREGTTLIIEERVAREHGIAFSFRSRMITLDIHSSLDAVGFLAFISTRLAAAGLPVNPVSGYFHDHLFIPADRAEEAMAILNGIVVENGRY